MSTTESFNNMLKKYMPYSLLFEELVKRDYFLTKVEKDQKWKGGEMQVPFRGGKASSFSQGSLTAEADVTETSHVLGTVPGYKEIWGTMVFHQKDLDQHDSMEQSFIKILPDQLEEFIDDMKDIVSTSLLNGQSIDPLTIGGAGEDLLNGVVVVKRPARLQIGQYLEFGTEGPAAVAKGSGYISQIVVDTKLVTIVTNKDLTGPVVDLSATGANLIAGDKAYIRGAIDDANTFTALPDQLLSAANGGSAALFGQTKLAFPHLQAQNFDGSTITAANLLQKIFEFQNETRQLGKGSPTDAVMSYKNLASAMQSLEGPASAVSQGRQFSATDTRASVFGWTEIDIVGVRGKLTIVGVHEMDDDKILIMDWRALKLHSNGFFERRESPNSGNQFYEVRATSGYQYFVDTRFYGELVVSKPSMCGIIHTINY